MSRPFNGDHMKKRSSLQLDRDLVNADWLRSSSPTQGDPQVRVLRMRYAGGIVRHLGLQMYAGAVPSIAELVANAWDADAANVTIKIPLGKSIACTSIGEVADDGRGMSFDDVNTLYLLVGRNRRRKGARTPQGRLVMGHKGIGKLAGFGIARKVEVWTVDDDGWLTAFRLDYDSIVRDENANLVETYSPVILADRKVTTNDPIAKRGTLVRLRDLQLRQAINPELFTDSMARRFAVFSHEFRLKINGQLIRRKDRPMILRIPKSGLRRELGPDAGPVRWWAGFTDKPIQDEEARGIAVIVRGKMAQEPFFFRLSGGTHGQVGMEYLIGEVQADFLDDKEDLIATDRASVLWEDPRARPLLTWGEQKVRDLLNARQKSKSDVTFKQLQESTHWSRIEKFPRRERSEMVKALRRISSIDSIDPEARDSITDSVIQAYEHEHLVQVVRELSTSTTSKKVLDLLQELDVQDAVASAQTIRGKIQALRQLRKIASDKPELIDWPAIARGHPWVGHADWQLLKPAKGKLAKLAPSLGRVKGISKVVAFVGFRRVGVLVFIDGPADGVADLERLVERTARVADHSLRFVETVVISLQGRREPAGTRSIDDWLKGTEDDYSAILNAIRRALPSDPRVRALPS